VNRPCASGRAFAGLRGEIRAAQAAPQPRRRWEWVYPVAIVVLIAALNVESWMNRRAGDRLREATRALAAQRETLKGFQALLLQSGLDCSLDTGICYGNPTAFQEQGPLPGAPHYIPNTADSLEVTQQ
jgi:hypothetical protein